MTDTIRHVHYSQYTILVREVDHDVNASGAAGYGDQ
jgi:hypothetical protein